MTNSLRLLSTPITAPLPVSARSVLPLSAVLITFNSARMLPAVLQAVAWCDEVLIVDSGSTDHTLDIAAKHGCRVLHHDFDGFGPQKQFAVDQAQHDWVLVVDADELVTPDLRDEIQRRLATDRDMPVKGYQIPISLIFLGCAMRGGEHKRPNLRLFDRRAGRFNANRVHEEVLLNGPTARLSGQMLHYSYGSLHEYFEKFNRYTTAGAEELLRRGRTGSVWPVLFRFPFTFFKEYVLKKNVLNGYAGFVWSLLSAMYPVVKYAKLREMRQQKKSATVAADSTDL